MLTKGIILNKLVNDNHYMVRIPILETAGDTEFSSIEAILSYTPGMRESFKVGDVVIVGFEDHSAFNPIILGKLWLSKDDESRGFADVEAVNVLSSARLPEDTKIAEISYKDLATLIRKVEVLEARVEALES